MGKHNLIIAYAYKPSGKSMLFGCRFVHVNFREKIKNEDIISRKEASLWTKEEYFLVY